MKKTILFAMMAAVLGFTACSKEEPTQTETPKKGMVLHATVAQPADSKATFTNNEGVWHFDFTEGDEIKVTNKEIGFDKFYTFTYDGEKFVSEDAKPASKAVTWYAFYPSNSVSLVGQSGKWEDVANKYIMNGSTSTMVTGTDGLNITMSPKVAILKINNLKVNLDINVKFSKDYWVSYYNNTSPFGGPSSNFVLNGEDTQQNLLSTTKIGTYYIAVPAGVQLVVKDGEKTLKSTGTSGLEAGKYYELIINLQFGQGFAEVKTEAGIPGNCVKWIQLWKDGPKFAEYNVGVTDGRAESYGDYYAWADTIASAQWGDNWRMPTRDEFADLKKNCTYEEVVVTQDSVKGMIFTGKGDYKGNSIFLPYGGYVSPKFGNGYINSLGAYWSKTLYDQTHANFLMVDNDVPEENRILLEFELSVRAVLAEQ